MSDIVPTDDDIDAMYRDLQAIELTGHSTDALQRQIEQAEEARARQMGEYARARSGLDLAKVADLFSRIDAALAPNPFALRVDIVVTRDLRRPRLRRERGPGWVNLDAVAENQRALTEASKVYFLKPSAFAGEKIVVPAWLWPGLSASLQKAGVECSVQLPPPRTRPRNARERRHRRIENKRRKRKPQQ